MMIPMLVRYGEKISFTAFLHNEFLDFCRWLYNVAVSIIILEIILVLGLLIIYLFDKVYYTVDWKLWKEKWRKRK